MRTQVPGRLQGPPYVTTPGAPVSARLSLVTEAGRDGVQPA
ncbi:hypothetical protein [Streptomyces sp. NPDC047985]